MFLDEDGTNEGQGGVRVGIMFFAAYLNIRDRDSGSGRRRQTAEHAVLLNIDNFYGRGETQRYVKPGLDEWVTAGTLYVPVPLDPLSR